MTGAGAVAGLVLLEWGAGWLATAAWTQSWDVVRRGHFRILGYGALILAVLVVTIDRTSLPDDPARFALIVAFAGAAVIYVLVQYSRTDLPGVVAGGVAATCGAAALVVAAGDVADWTQAVAAIEFVTGAALLGGVTNGMLLGHWYLNQPGLKPWALARLTNFSLGATIVVAVVGLAAAGKLATASTEGAILGLPGFGESFGAVFFAAWIVLIAFTGAVVWMARRCVAIKSIQSATGLYYVALLTAGVSEFMVRYLMVNAT
ncbi:MAG: hypothetical protein M3280_07345 [Actinomycetota bacterium]|nr:hypothetical protein [Actinomycetota bacterium]